MKYMQTYISKPEIGFPELEIRNNTEMMEILGLQDSRKLKILFKNLMVASFVRFF